MDTKRYMREVERNLSMGIKRRVRVKLLERVRSTVTEIAAGQEGASYDDLCRLLGEPQKMADKALASLDDQTMRKMLNTKQYVLRCVIGAIAAILLLGCVTYYVTLMDCWYSTDGTLWHWPWDTPVSYYTNEEDYNNDQ